MKEYIITVLTIVAITGCGPSYGSIIDTYIEKYQAVSGQVELGDRKDKALAILLPTQEGLPTSARKEPEKYFKEQVKVEIHYMRSGRQPDGLTTDDEFVPYLFNDGILVAIGWQSLGGPKTQGQTSSDTHIYNQNKVIIW